MRRYDQGLEVWGIGSWASRGLYPETKMRYAQIKASGLGVWYHQLYLSTLASLHLHDCYIRPELTLLSILVLGLMLKAILRKWDSGGFLEG